MGVTPTQIPPNQFDNKSITFKCGHDVFDMLEFEWNPSRYHQLPSNIQSCIIVILMMSLKEPITRIPIHPETLFYLLPKEIIHLIFHWLCKL